MAKVKRRFQSEPVKRFRLPQGVLLDKLIESQEPRRVRPLETVSLGKVLVRKIKDQRLPIIGLRSQREVRKERNGRFKGFDATKHYQRREPSLKAPREICRRRHERRSVLFSLKIAGFGRKRSPGAGGTYKRKPESLMRC